MSDSGTSRAFHNLFCLIAAAAGSVCVKVHKIGMAPRGLRTAIRITK